MTGVALAARRGTPPGAGADGPDDRRAAAGWALVSSVGFGIFLAGMAPAADAGIFWAVALSRVSLLAIFVAVALRVASPLRVGGRDVPRVMVPGLLLFGGTLLYTAATREGDLSVVAVLGSLFPVVTVGLAYVLLGERLTRVQGAGAVAAMVGSVLLAAARCALRPGRPRARAPARGRPRAGPTRTPGTSLRRPAPACGSGTDLLLRFVVAAKALQEAHERHSSEARDPWPRG